MPLADHQCILTLIVHSSTIWCFDDGGEDVLWHKGVEDLVISKGTACESSSHHLVIAHSLRIRFSSWKRSLLLQQKYCLKQVNTQNNIALFFQLPFPLMVSVNSNHVPFFSACQLSLQRISLFYFFWQNVGFTGIAHTLSGKSIGPIKHYPENIKCHTF